MGYEFDCTDFSVNINDENKFGDMISELKKVEGRSFFADDITINDRLYDYDPSFYPNNNKPLRLKHGCCYKLHNLDQIFKILAKYCIGEMEFECEYGELLEVQLSNQAYSFGVRVYKSVLIDEVPELKSKFNFQEEEGI